MPPLAQAILFALTIFFACMIQGISGFGFAVIVSPLLYYLFPASSLVTLFSVISITLNLYLLISIKAPIPYKQIAILLGGAVCGLPLGVYILSTVSAPHLKLAVGVITLIFLTLIMVSPRLVRPKPQLSYFIGLIAGALQGSIGVNGPPIALYVNSLSQNKAQIRKTLAFIFLPLSALTLVLLAHRSLLSHNQIVQGLFISPLALAGGMIGSHLAHHLPLTLFRRLVFLLILLSALTLILSSI